MSAKELNMKARDDMFRFVLKGKGAVQKVTRMVLEEISWKLVYRSVVGNPELWHPPYWPKGYVPGHFKNNWQLGVDTVPTGEIPGSDKMGHASMERMRKAIPRWPVGHVYYFVNNVPYAALLETGLHSTQVPPQGIVGLTRMEFAQICRQAELDYIASEGK
jgi:hypothetical protein